MAVNPDPRPGRWILPLVVLAMIAFTYFFVRELPEASPDTTQLAGDTTTTTSPDDSTTTTASAIDPETLAYVEQVREIRDGLEAQRQELEAANSGFDASPRTVEYQDAVSRFQAVATATSELADRLEGLTPPEDFQPNHQVLLTHLDAAAGAAEDALAGLQSDDPGVIRRNSVEAYGNAAASFVEEVGILEDAAGVDAS
jgi:hypothetical protein